jgi:hypothetical protein
VSFFSFLQSGLITWRSHELVRRERHFLLAIVSIPK